MHSLLVRLLCAISFVASANAQVGDAGEIEGLRAELGQVSLVEVGRVDNGSLVLAIGLHREYIDDRFQARCLDGVPNRVLDFGPDPVVDVAQEDVIRLAICATELDVRPNRSSRIDRKT